jgi:hypothetical protein
MTKRTQRKRWGIGPGWWERPSLITRKAPRHSEAAKLGWRHRRRGRVAASSLRQRSHSSAPRKMTLEEYIKEHNIEPSELHYDLEMSLQDYYRKHPEMGKAEAYDAWFKENRKFIEDVVREVAKEDNVEIIKGRKTAKPKRSKEKEPEGAWFHYYTVTERDIPIIGIGSVSHQSNMLRGEQKS